MTEADPKRTGWAILSTGHIASVFARDLALLPDEARLVAVGSRTATKAAAFAEAYGFERSHGTYADLAEDPDVDVVYVASTHNDHAGSARLCLEAGKSVLVEKPLTVTPGEAEELVALARDRGLFLMEAMWMRTNPLVRRAAEIAASGELGAIRHVTATFGFAFDGDAGHRLLDPEQAGGAVLDLGVYPVHGVHLFLGEPGSVQAYGSLAGTGVDAHAAALLGYPATETRPAATASVACSLEADLPTRIEVFCTGGRIVLDKCIRPEEVLVFRGRDPEPERLTHDWTGGGYTFQAREVMRCLRSGELESPMVPWSSSLASMRTLQRWIEGVREGH